MTDLVENLSTAEINLIKKSRDDKTFKNLVRYLHAESMRIISIWSEYTAHTGDGLTFSTFVDNFDCDKYIADDLLQYRRIIFNILKEVLTSSQLKIINELNDTK